MSVKRPLNERCSRQDNEAELDRRFGLVPFLRGRSGAEMSPFRKREGLVMGFPFGMYRNKETKVVVE